MYILFIVILSKNQLIMKMVNGVCCYTCKLLLAESAGDFLHQLNGIIWIAHSHYLGTHFKVMTCYI